MKGSRGYIVADLTDEEMRKASLAGELFIGALGRIDADRIIAYYCSNCAKEFNNAPRIVSKSINEEVTDAHMLMEQGEYVCSECNNVIAIYKVFGTTSKEGISMKDIIGFNVVYKQERVGVVKDVVVDRSCRISLFIDTQDGNASIPWDMVLEVRDNIMLKGRLCNTCNNENLPTASFCIECGNRLK